MIITLSGRRVKRPVKIFAAERGRRMRCGGAPVLIRQAKALAPWAGVRYSLVVARCPCSPDQPVRPGFRYCWDCLSIASTDAHFREDDYRVREAA